MADALDLLEELEAAFKAHLEKPSYANGEDWRAARAAVLARMAEPAPVPMILHCPSCGTQHVDEPDERTPGWANPPHRSHLCHSCGTIWRPADVATVGVRAIGTKGQADTWDGTAPAARMAGPGEVVVPKEPTDKMIDAAIKTAEHVADRDGEMYPLYSVSEVYAVMLAARPNNGGPDDAAA